MNKEFINMSLMWTAITSTVAAVLWMMSTFATAAEVEDIKLNIAYGQYYDRLDDYEEALEEERDALAREYRKQMERLRAYICEEDPEWERCEDDD